ncbi:MAG: RsmB/NOP family class I SAM-dependent RNA methyltransferase [Hyphomicrobiales bacterium]|nr:RsmB/NOP family class I SAM-dependent RNA methyltransferase [Hyphomicrobiales bacterium]
MNPSQGRRAPSRSAEGPAADDKVPGLAARKTAAKLLATVIDARTPLDGLTDNDNGHPYYLALDARDRSLVRAILTTALRFRVTIGKLLSRRLERPLPPNAHTLTHILHVAAAQILFLDIPDSAAVDLAVTHAKSDPRTTRFAALVNGVLRSMARSKDAELEPMLATTLDAPDWFVARLTAAYGADRTTAILAAHRIEAPVDVSVKSNPQLWAERLGGMVLPTGGVRIERLAASVPELPGFADGEWWVQDAAAGLPARLLGDIAGKNVADLCAAPGGKTTQLVLAGANVTAIDTSKNRLSRLGQNLARLNLQAQMVQADLLAYEPPELFDAVLLDAPCSSTGTIRRHPDVPWTKSAADIEKLAALQARMIVVAARLVKPGGRVVFSNCSLDPSEGEALFAAFLAASPDVVLDPAVAGEVPGMDSFLSKQGLLRTTPADLQLANPGVSGLDGFFAARFRRLP